MIVNMPGRRTEGIEELFGMLSALAVLLLSVHLETRDERGGFFHVDLRTSVCGGFS